MMSPAKLPDNPTTFVKKYNPYVVNIVNVKRVASPEVHMRSPLQVTSFSRYFAFFLSSFSFQPRQMRNGSKSH